MNALRSWLSRLIAPNLFRCYRCKTSLFGPIRNERHTTFWTSDRGCFPLCEKCWASLPPNERMHYYDALVDTWIKGFPSNREEYEEDRKSIRQAVMRGI